MVNIDKLRSFLKARRLELKISQAQLATDLNLTTSGYRKMENGQSPISIERFVMICELLGSNPCELLEGITEVSSKDLLKIENKRLSSEVEFLKSEIHYQRELNNKLLQLLNPKYVDLVVSWGLETRV